MVVLRIPLWLTWYDFYYQQGIEQHFSGNPLLRTFKMSPSVEILLLLTPFAELMDPALEIPDEVLGLLTPLFHRYNPWKPDNNPLAVLQCTHTNLGPQSISNSGSPQDHLLMSIILSSLNT